MATPIKPITTQDILANINSTVQSRQTGFPDYLNDVSGETLKNAGFLADVRKAYQARDGIDFGTDQDAISHFLSDRRWSNINTLGIAGDWLSDMPDDQKELFARLQSVYDELPWFVDESGQRSLKGFGQALLYGVADPTNLIGVGEAVKAAQVAAIAGKPLLKAAGTGLAKGSAAEFGLQGTIGFGQDYGTQQRNIEFGLQDEYSMAQGAASALLSGAAGAGIVAGTAVLGDVIGKGVLSGARQGAAIRSQLQSLNYSDAEIAAMPLKDVPAIIAERRVSPSFIERQAAAEAEKAAAGQKATSEAVNAVAPNQATQKTGPEIITDAIALRRQRLAALSREAVEGDPSNAAGVQSEINDVQRELEALLEAKNHDRVLAGLNARKDEAELAGKFNEAAQIEVQISALEARRNSITKPDLTEREVEDYLKSLAPLATDPAGTQPGSPATPQESQPTDNAEATAVSDGSGGSPEGSEQAPAQPGEAAAPTPESSYPIYTNDEAVAQLVGEGYSEAEARTLVRDAGKSGAEDKKKAISDTVEGNRGYGQAMGQFADLVETLGPDIANDDIFNAIMAADPALTKFADKINSVRDQYKAALSMAAQPIEQNMDEKVLGKKLMEAIGDSDVVRRLVNGFRASVQKRNPDITPTHLDFLTKNFIDTITAAPAERKPRDPMASRLGKGDIDVAMGGKPQSGMSKSAPGTEHLEKAGGEFVGRPPSRGQFTKLTLEAEVEKLANQAMFAEADAGKKAVSTKKRDPRSIAPIYITWNGKREMTADGVAFTHGDSVWYDPATRRFWYDINKANWTGREAAKAEVASFGKRPDIVPVERANRPADAKSVVPDGAKLATAQGWSKNDPNKAYEFIVEDEFGTEDGKAVKIGPKAANGNILPAGRSAYVYQGQVYGSATDLPFLKEEAAPAATAAPTQPVKASAKAADMAAAFVRYKDHQSKAKLAADLEMIRKKHEGAAASAPAPTTPTEAPAEAKPAPQGYVAAVIPVGELVPDRPIAGIRVQGRNQAAGPDIHDRLIGKSDPNTFRKVWVPDGKAKTDLRPTDLLDLDGKKLPEASSDAVATPTETPPADTPTVRPLNRLDAATQNFEVPEVAAWVFRTLPRPPTVVEGHAALALLHIAPTKRSAAGQLVEHAIASAPVRQRLAAAAALERVLPPVERPRVEKAAAIAKVRETFANAPYEQVVAIRDMLRRIDSASLPPISTGTTPYGIGGTYTAFDVDPAGKMFVADDVVVGNTTFNQPSGVLAHELAHWAYHNLLTGEQRSEFLAWVLKDMDGNGQLRGELASISPAYAAIDVGDKQLRPYTDIRPNEIFADAFQHWVSQTGKSRVVGPETLWKQVVRYVRALVEKYLDPNTQFPAEIETLFERILPPEAKAQQFVTPKTEAGAKIHALLTGVDDQRVRLENGINSYDPATIGPAIQQALRFIQQLPSSGYSALVNEEIQATVEGFAKVANQVWQRAAKTPSLARERAIFEITDIANDVVDAIAEFQTKLNERYQSVEKGQARLASNDPLNARTPKTKKGQVIAPFMARMRDYRDSIQQRLAASARAVEMPDNMEFAREIADYLEKDFGQLKMVGHLHGGARRTERRGQEIKLRDAGKPYDARIASLPERGSEDLAKQLWDMTGGRPATADVANEIRVDWTADLENQVLDVLDQANELFNLAETSLLSNFRSAEGFDLDTGVLAKRDHRVTKAKRGQILAKLRRSILAEVSAYPHSVARVEKFRHLGKMIKEAIAVAGENRDRKMLDRLGKLQDKLTSVLTTDRKGVTPGTDSAHLSINSIVQKSEISVVLDAARAGENTLPERAAAFELARRGRALPHPHTHTDVRPEFQALSDDGITDELNRALDANDQAAVNELREEAWRRDTMATQAGRPVLYPRDKATKQAIGREVDAWTGVPDDDGVPPNAPQWVKDIVRKVRHKNQQLQYSQRLLTYRALNLLPKEVKNAMADVAILSIDEADRLAGGGRVRPEARGVFVTQSPEWDGLKRAVSGVAIGLTEGTSTPLDAVHEVMHFALRTRVFSADDQNLIIEAFRAARRNGDVLAALTERIEGADNELKLAEEWFVERTAQHVIGKIAKGDIFQARLGGVDAEAQLILRNRLGTLIGRFIDTVAYLVNGLIGRNDVRQLMRRMTMYGDVLGGRVRASAETDIVDIFAHLPPDLQEHFIREAAPATRKKLMKKFASGIGVDEKGEIVFWYHGSPAGKFLNKEANPIPVASGWGRRGSGFYMTRNKNVAFETYAQSYTVEAAKKLAERSGRKSKADLITIEELATDRIEVLNLLRKAADEQSRLKTELLNSNSMLGEAGEIDAEVKGNRVADLERTKKAWARRLKEIDAELGLYGARPQPVMLTLVARTGDREDAMFNAKPDHMLDTASEQVLRTRDALDMAEFGFDDDLMAKFDERVMAGQLSGEDLWQNVHDLFYHQMARNDGAFVEDLQAVSKEAMAATTELLKLAGYEGVIDTHINRLDDGATVHHETAIIFEPEGRIKDVTADYFDQEQPELYHSSPAVNVFGDMKPLGELATAIARTDGPLTVANTGPMLSAFSAAGVSKPITSALAKLMNKRTPGPLEREALARAGFHNYLQSNAQRLRSVSNAKTVADWLQPKNGVGHFDRLLRRVADDVVPVVSMLDKLPGAAGFKGWLRHNKFWGEVAQPESFTRIAKALRRGQGTKYWTDLAPEELAIANAIRNKFIDKLGELRNSGIVMGEVKNYFPQIWDVEKIKANSDRFTKLLADYLERESDIDITRNRITREEATIRAQRIIASLINDEGVYLPSHAGTRAPTADHVDYQRMIRLHDPAFAAQLSAFENGGFIVNDLKGIIAKYFDTANRRLDFMERWGEGNHAYYDYQAVAAYGIDAVKQLLTTRKIMKVRRDYVSDNGVEQNAFNITTIQPLDFNIIGGVAKQLFDLTQKGDKNAAMNLLLAVQPYDSPAYRKRAQAVVDALVDFKEAIGRDPAGRAPGMNANEIAFMENFFRVSQRKRVELGYGGETMAKVSKGVRNFNSVSLLTATTLASIPDLGMSLLRTGNMKAWMTGLSKFAVDKEYRSAFRGIGVGVENIIHQNMANLYGGGGSRASNAFFNLIGLTPWTEMQGEVASAVGWEAFKAEQRRALANLPAPGKSNRAYRVAMRFLDRYGLAEYARPGAQSLETLDINSPEAAAVRDALHKFRNETIFAPNPSDIPLWAQTPWGSVVFQLKQYPLMFSRLGGYVATEAANGNYGPALAMFTMGTGLGAASLATRDLIQGRGGDNRDKEHALRERTLTKWLEQFGYKGDIHGPADEFLGWYIEGFMAMGGLGLLGDIIYNTAAQADNGAFGAQRMASVVFGPTVGLGFDAYNVVVQGGTAALGNVTGLGGPSNYKERDAMRTITSRIPVIGGFHTVREAAADTLAGERYSDTKSGGWGSGSGWN
jgi:hypothetical protein